MYKKSYFQGTEEPTPKKKKYKSEKSILVQPRFKEPLYNNYDLYDVKGIYDSSKLGPGIGWHHMNKYKSISEFRDAKHKYIYDKYKDDDSWIEDNKKERINKMKIRCQFINFIIKNAIDFSIDDQIGSDPILGNSGTYHDSPQIGGQLDKYLPQVDFEGKLPNELNFGRDYIECFDSSKIDIKKLMDKYLQTSEPSLYGLPDGINPKEDLDSPSEEQPQYGTTDSGNTFYNEI